MTETVSRTVSSKPPSNGTLNESMVSFSAVTRYAQKSAVVLIVVFQIELKLGILLQARGDS